MLHWKFVPRVIRRAVWFPSLLYSMLIDAYRDPQMRFRTLRDFIVDTWSLTGVIE